ncbi:MAG TPA: excinuclease ABC subunit B, partial [Thiolapillus brandeum]|nr:excinuclease ABC subunit B [Thiolapillus brandeum]
ILDADKEGFLRSTRSLIQTIGRAARNARGKAILYADTVTGSMQQAIDETNRRRAKQIAWNEARGITPKTVQKKVADIMEAGYPGGSQLPKRYARVAEEEAAYAALTPRELARKLEELEEQMYEHARNLEFEEAAKVRDRIRELKEMGLVA